MTPAELQKLRTDLLAAWAVWFFRLPSGRTIARPGALLTWSRRHR